MFAIRKITPTYDATEDRIALNAQADNGDVLRLWCTQRLVNRLAAAFGGMLDQNLQQVAAGRSDARLHAFEQSAAQAQLKPDRPVAVNPSTSTTALLTSVDITPRGQAYTLVFKDPTGPVASLTITATELRQWLGIVHRLYATAQWPTTHWPGWFDAAAKPAEKADASQLH